MGTLWYIEGKRTRELFAMGKNATYIDNILSKRFPRERFVRVVTRWWQRWRQDDAMWVYPANEHKLPAGHDCIAARCVTKRHEYKTPKPWTDVYTYHRIGKYAFLDDLPIYDDSDPDDTIGALAGRLWDWLERNGWEWAVHMDSSDIPELPIDDGVSTHDRRGRRYGQW